MLKCQREGWSCLSGSFLRKLNLPWFPAWVLHQLRSPFREQPVHSFCLRMTVVPPSSSHWDPTRGSSARGLGVLLAQGEMIKLRLNFNSTECESWKGPRRRGIPTLSWESSWRPSPWSWQREGGRGNQRACLLLSTLLFVSRLGHLHISPAWISLLGAREGAVGRTRQDQKWLVA